MFDFAIRNVQMNNYLIITVDHILSLRSRLHIMLPRGTLHEQTQDTVKHNGCYEINIH